MSAWYTIRLCLLLELCDLFLFSVFPLQVGRLFPLNVKSSLLLFLLTCKTSEFTMQPFRMMHSSARPSFAELQSTQGEPTDCAKPVIIGLYGLPGAGKTFWLDKLKTVLGNDDFAFYDGSDIIAAVTPGGLEAFQDLMQEVQSRCRERAIARIKQEC